MSTCISDDRLSESRLIRVERKLDNLSKGVENISLKLCDEYMKRCIESEKQLETKHMEAEGLRSELQSLEKQLQQEKADSQDKVEQIEKKSTEAEGLRSELQSLKKQLHQEKADSRDKVEQIETKSTEAEGLRSELQSLRKRLQQEKADSREKVELFEMKSTEAKGLRSTLQSLRKQSLQEKADSQDKVAGLTTTIQQLDEDKKKLREVILTQVNLGNTLRYQISDDEIRQRFVYMRQSIQSVVNNLKTRDFISFIAVNDFESRLHQCYNSYSPKDRIFLVRSVLYQIIDESILKGDAFGLAGSVRVPPQYNLEALDQSLSGFEDLLRVTKVTNKVISDWRIATFQCIEGFSATPQDNSDARGRIRRLLFPLLDSDFSKQDWLKSSTKIDQLCDDAFSLRLLTRKSGDQYGFQEPGNGQVFSPTKGVVEVCGALGGGEVSNTVAFSICGALIKYTLNDGTWTENFLEPAHVVVQAKLSKKPSSIPKNRRVVRKRTNEVEK
ncbi:hypothetical protein E4U37_003524 [Claviceps purpurea]|nr:hypothetical protein E4U37_003524 [Claviceps purpurea]